MFVAVTWVRGENPPYTAARMLHASKFISEMLMRLTEDEIYVTVLPIVESE